MHLAAFRRQSRVFRAEARARKPQLVDAFLSEASECSLRQDPAQWYQRIRRICPAGRREGIHLRDAAGHLLRPQESMHELQTFFGDLFQDAQYRPKPLPALPKVPFTVEELQHAICKLPSRQAALPTVAPSVVWKDVAYELAQHIHQALEQCWCSDQPCYLPEEWHLAVLCLLPKPGKPPKSPGNLRPICIQHPICKILTGLASDKARAEKPHLFEQLPCFRYERHRSAEDCLLKVFGHCKYVQSITCQGGSTKGRQMSLKGGLQVCLDMTRAFDKVSRTLVEASIRAASFSKETETAMLTWLQGGLYELQHKGLTSRVPCNRGIKQGSKGGSYEWNIITRYVLLQLIRRKGIVWVQNHITIYADGWHLRWSGVSEQMFHRAAGEAAEILELLTELGFEINLTKSVAVLKLVGSRAKAFSKTFVRKHRDGTALKCTTKTGTVFNIPIVRKCDYLGAVIGYEQPVRDTVCRRIKAAEYTFKRLQPVLGDRRTLTLQQRLAVYDTCVSSTLTYATLAAGPGRADLLRIHAVVIRHLRHMARSPRHVTHESNLALCDRLGRSLPLLWVRGTLEKKQAAWSVRRQRLTSAG